MRRPVCVLISLAALAPALRATNGAKDVPPAGRYRALVREYQGAQQVYYKAMRDAKADADRRKALARKPSPREYAERFLVLARSAPKDPAAFDALSWVLTYSANGPEADEALGVLAREHAADKRLGPVVRRLASSRSPEAEALLRVAAEKSPHREVQAQACYALAGLLSAKAGRPASGEGGDDARKEAEPGKIPREEAEAMYERLAEKFADVKATRKKTYGDLARSGLARLRQKAGGAAAHTDPDSPPAAAVGLEVGMLPPPIEGFDTDGRPMRLGEYRGTVVVLDFWGHW